MRPGDEGRLQDWLLQLQRDVNALKERPASVSIGRWVVEEDGDGQLVARNTVTGDVTTLGEV